MARGSKRNWTALRKLWITGQWPSLTAFAKDNKIPLPSLLKYAAKHGWLRAAERMQEHAEIMATSKLADKIADARWRAERVGLVFQHDGMKEFNRKRRSLTAREASLVVRDGIALERQALGMDDDKPAAGAGVNMLVNQMQVLIGGNGDDPATARKLQETLRDTAKG
jgi:hypothetical protein